MIKLAKYLKPFSAGLVLTVLLLFAQALSDINLPNFMSDIVDTGIQKSGIAHSAPEAMSENAMRLATLAMTEGEKTLVKASYSLVQTSEKNNKNKTYSDIYTAASGNLWTKNKTDKDNAQALDRVFELSARTLIYLSRGSATENDKTDSTTDGFGNFNLNNVYRQLPALEKIPAQMLGEARSKAEQSDKTLLAQSGTMMAKLFYTELGANIGAMAAAYITKVGLKMLAIALLGGAATVSISFLSSKIAAGTSRDLRRALFEKIENFSNNEFDKFSTASLITRCTNDVTQIQMLLMMGIRMVCYAPLMAIGGIVMAVKKSVSTSWVIAVACIVLVGFIFILMSIAIPKFKILQKLVDRLNLISRENLTGLMVIRAFRTEEFEKKRFEKANEDLTKTTLFVTRVMVLMMPVMTLIMNATTLTILWISAHKIAESSMQLGNMMAFMQYAMQIIFSFLMISMMFVSIPRAAVSAQRISEVLETPLSITDPENPKDFDEKKKGLVEFRDVSFRYRGAGQDALSNITFTAKPGQTTAIIGSTGSGKSTIASLALRFYDASQGQVLIEGTDVREVRQKDLRRKIGYVPQKGVLLSGTIASNIRYGNNSATDEDVKNVAEVAHALDFIMEKEGGFEGKIAQGGTNVSGGQKQRLSIARALAKKAQIYIFDDSFSALDFKTDAAVRKALKAFTGDSTVIIVAQRVSTIMNAEQIIVLDEGRIVGTGTHRELLKNCPEYYEIAASQLSPEELK